MTEPRRYKDMSPLEKYRAYDGAAAIIGFFYEGEHYDIVCSSAVNAQGIRSELRNACGIRRVSLKSRTSGITPDSLVFSGDIDINEILRYLYEQD